MSSCENEPSNVVERREDLRHHEASVTQITSPVNEHPISLSEISKKCIRIKRSPFKSEEEIVEIESKTRQQSACQEWYKQRFGRVTASKSYRVGCNPKAVTSPTKIIKEALHYNEDYQSQAVKDGLENEQLVLDKYTDLMHQQGHM